MYAIKQLPTIPLIQAKLRETTDIHISNNRLRLALHKLKYCFRRTPDNRRIAVERPEAVAARALFLREVRNYRNLEYQIVYLDETWVSQHHCKSLAWYPTRQELEQVMQQPDVVGFAKMPNIPSGKGKRIIVLHAGSSEAGFIPDMEEVCVFYNLLFGV